MKKPPSKPAKPRKRSAAPIIPKNPSRIQRSEAVWLDGKVPAGFWDHPENRKLYMRWLGQRLGFRKVEDYYQLTTDDLKENRGAAVLMYWWRSSAIGAVKECFPEYDWKEWCFHCCPRAFWHDPKNHRRYMDWLAKELGITSPEGWYHVTNRDFATHKGGAFLLWYQSTISRAIMHHYPDFPWQEWLFDKTPKGFWRTMENRRRYMNWLGEKLGITDREQWYHVTRREFQKYHGIQFLKLYDGSPPAAIQDCFPDYPWQEWLFSRVPAGFWKKAENRKRYMVWLGKKLGLRKPKDWLSVNKRTFYQNHGSGLVVSLSSYYDLLKECVPEIDWDARRSMK